MHSHCHARELTVASGRKGIWLKLLCDAENAHIPLYTALHWSIQVQDINNVLVLLTRTDNEVTVCININLKHGCPRTVHVHCYHQLLAAVVLFSVS